MPEAVYRMLTLLCDLVEPVPVGTNLGLLHLLWMLVSGRLLEARGAVIPGLSACGLPERAVRRAWAALGQGDWAIGALLARWQTQVRAEGQWQPRPHGGYHPVAVDMTAFWRPRLQTCATTHYHAEAGKALPAIPVGLIARVGGVGGQRLALPLAFVRADTADPSASAHLRLLVRAAVAHCAPDDALVLDAGFSVALLPRGRGHALRGAPGQEQHVPPCQSPALSGPRPPADTWSAGAPAAAHVQGPEHPGHPARSGGDLDRGGCRAPRGVLGRPGAARRGGGQPHPHRGRPLRSPLSRPLAARLLAPALRSGAAGLLR